MHSRVSVLCSSKWSPHSFLTSQPLSKPLSYGCLVVYVFQLNYDRLYELIASLTSGSQEGSQREHTTVWAIWRALVFFLCVSKCRHRPNPLPHITSHTRTDVTLWTPIPQPFVKSCHEKVTDNGWKPTLTKKAVMGGVWRNVFCVYVLFRKLKSGHFTSVCIHTYCLSADMTLWAIQKEQPMWQKGKRHVIS